MLHLPGRHLKAKEGLLQGCKTPAIPISFDTRKLSAKACIYMDYFIQITLNVYSIVQMKGLSTLRK